MQTVEEIRKKLQEVLHDTPYDYSRILELSNQLAASDEKHVRFSVDSGIINRLGNELVGKRETAVGELIKNAYDADADQVNLIFERAWTPGGTLRIEDTGNGMTREQLINGFMRLSSASKVNEPYSPLFHRARAGKKGIGRFAAQRLGNKLTIITQTKNSLNALKVTFEWSRFVSDTELWSVESTIEEIDKQKPQGTNLIIEELREGWTDALLAKTNRSVMTLLQPFPLGGNDEESYDPGIQISFYRDRISKDTKVIDSVESVYDLALAEINGCVDEEGLAHWSMNSIRLNDTTHFDSDKDNPKEIYKLLKGVKLRAYYYIYESSLFPRGAMNYVKEIASEYGGIRIYRNGFRVLPYGEKGNDWLGLDESVTRRTILSPHQNSNFFGLIELKGEYLLQEFEETASREGLIENEAYNELVRCIFQMLTTVTLKVSELRGRKGRAAQKDWDKNPTIKVDTALEELKNIIETNQEKEHKSSNERDGHSGRWEFYNQAKSLINEIYTKRQEERVVIDSLMDENKMLRVLASVGLVVGEFVHEVKRFLPAFRASINRIKSFVQNADENVIVENLENQVTGFTSYTSYFETNISQNIVRQLEPIAPHKQVRDFIDVITNDLKRTGIIMVPPELRGINLRTVPMHSSEWMSILFNLYTNSKKAILKADKKTNNIFIKVDEDDKYVILEFSDTGIGIPEENWEKIFDAFYTTSKPVVENMSNQDLSGSGLGLKIVRDIVESYGGTIRVVPPITNYNTTIQIKIPKNK